MSDSRERLSYRGFDLRLSNGFTAGEARAIVDRVLASAGDRVAFVVPRAGVARGLAVEERKRLPRLYVKAEFRRPDQPLGKRLRPARAIAEGRGYRAFQKVGLPVPRLFAFGEQSRLRPRAGSLVVSEKIRALNAARSYLREPSAGLLERVGRTLARVHAAGLVHGDAVLRNFVLVSGAEYVVDLPGWRRFSAERAERDLVLCVGSAMKIGAGAEDVARLLRAYEDARGARAAAPGDGGRERILEQADAFRRYLVDRDTTRPERHAKRLATRVRERTPSGTLPRR